MSIHTQRVCAAVWLLAGCAGWLPRAHAASPFELVLTATSDYIYRGVSQSHGNPALQAALNYRSASGWYAGAWLSNVEPYPFGGKFVELDVYGGRGWLLGSRWFARAGYTRYAYIRDNRPAPYDYGELQISLSLDNRVTATASWQPDGTGYSSLGYARSQTASAFELSARWPLARGFFWEGGFGRYDVRRLYGASYAAGQMGIGWAKGRVQIDVQRFYAEPMARRLFAEASADGSWAASIALRY